MNTFSLKVNGQKTGNYEFQVFAKGSDTEGLIFAYSDDCEVDALKEILTELLKKDQLKGVIKGGYQGEAFEAELNGKPIRFMLETLTDKELEKCGISIPKKKASVSANMVNFTGSITTDNTLWVTLTGSAADRDWGKNFGNDEFMIPLEKNTGIKFKEKILELFASGRLTAYTTLDKKPRVFWYLDQNQIKNFNSETLEKVLKEDKNLQEFYIELPGSSFMNDKSFSFDNKSKGNKASVKLQLKIDIKEANHIDQILELINKLFYANKLTIISRVFTHHSEISWCINDENINQTHIENGKVFKDEFLKKFLSTAHEANNSLVSATEAAPILFSSQSATTSAIEHDKNETSTHALKFSN